MKIEHRYAGLCLLLTLSLILGLPLRDSGYGAGVLGVLGPGAFYMAACAAGSTRRSRRVHLIAILPTTLITLKVCLVGGDDGQALLGTILMLGFLGFAASEILRRLARQDRVTADTVLGGISVYLLIGCVFFYVFNTLELIRPGSFLEGGRRLKPPVNVNHLLIRRPELIYYSFVTLTTVGFGDIVPVHPVARVLTVLEALLGQIYLVTYLTLIVGNFSSQRSASRIERAMAAMPTPDLGVERRGAEDGIRNRAVIDAAGGGGEGPLHRDIPPPVER